MSTFDRYNYIVRTLRMPGAVQGVLLVIDNHADEEGTCFLLQSTLAEESGFSQRHVRNAIQYLCRHGLLIARRHGHKASTFQLTLEAFHLASSKQQPAPRAERNRHHVPT